MRIKKELKSEIRYQVVAFSVPNNKIALYKLLIHAEELIPPYVKQNNST